MNLKTKLALGLMVTVLGGLASTPEARLVKTSSTTRAAQIGTFPNINLQGLLDKGYLVDSDAFDALVARHSSKIEEEAQSLGLNTSGILTVSATDLAQSYTLLTSGETRTLENNLGPVRDLIDASQTHWHAAGLPKVTYDFAFPENPGVLETKVLGSGLGKNIVYPISSVQQTYTTTCSYSTDDTSFPWLLSNPVSTEAYLNAGITTSTNGPIVSLYRDQIVWSHDTTSPLSCFETPAAEISRLQLRPSTTAGLENTFYLGVAAMESPTPQEATELLTTALQTYTFAEDLMFRGGHKLFMEEYVISHPELGFSTDDVANQTAWYTPRVQKASTVIGEIGLPEAVTRYKADPLWIVKATR